jgi:hypothetical protein
MWDRERGKRSKGTREIGGRQQQRKTAMAVWKMTVKQPNKNANASYNVLCLQRQPNNATASDRTNDGANASMPNNMPQRQPKDNANGIKTTNSHLHHLSGSVDSFFNEHYCRIHFYKSISKQMVG